MPDSSINGWGLLFMLYCLGIIVLIARNILSYNKLIRLVKNGVKSDGKNFKIIENEKVKSTFSVLNYIFLNSKNLSDTEKELILKHEVIHIEQKHWLDLLCGECVLLMQWFNPLAWLYVHLLKENHEFLVDRAVIDTGVSQTLYQAVLINQRFQEPVFSFSNSFNHSKPFNRLNMMKKTKSSPWKRLCALIIVPVFGLFIWASAVPRYVLNMKQSILLQDEEPTEFIRNSDIKVLDDTLKGKVLRIIIKDDREDPSAKSSDVKVNVLQDTLNTRRTLTYYYHSNNYQSKPFCLLQDTLKMRRTRTIVRDNDLNINIFMSDTVRVNNPLIIVDDVKSDINLQNLNPDDIKNISVLKDKTATAIYGEEAANGVVVIGIKKDDFNLPNDIKSIYFSKSLPDNVLCIIDGKIESVEKMKSIDPKIIESIEILKNESAISIYGEQGKNGVIKITTIKKNSQQEVNRK
jgi:TonB-dependent SusC/RagA subfamily outer membrane receptor